MPNKNYKKGARKEYAICKDLREEGFDIVQRTAGSHSPVDIIAISTGRKLIKLVQSKRTLNKTMSYIDSKQAKKILEENRDLWGLFHVIFEVR